MNEGCQMLDIQLRECFGAMEPDLAMETNFGGVQ